MPAGRPVTWFIAFMLVAVLGVAITVAVVMAHIWSSANPGGTCVGGPATGQTGQPAGNGNYRFDCSGGGSVIVHLGS